MSELSPFSAYEALEVLDAYRACRKTEQGRVYRFAQDALVRQENPIEDRAFVVVEDFLCFVRAQTWGDSREETCYQMELTPEQYDRYERAWQAIQAVYGEIEAAQEEKRQALEREAKYDFPS